MQYQIVVQTIYPDMRVGTPEAIVNGRTLGDLCKNLERTIPGLRDKAVAAHAVNSDVPQLAFDMTLTIEPPLS